MNIITKYIVIRYNKDGSVARKFSPFDFAWEAHACAKKECEDTIDLVVVYPPGK